MFHSQSVKLQDALIWGQQHGHPLHTDTKAPLRRGWHMSTSPLVTGCYWDFWYVWNTCGHLACCKFRGVLCLSNHWGPQSRFKDSCRIRVWHTSPSFNTIYKSLVTQHFCLRYADKIICEVQPCQCPCQSTFSMCRTRHVWLHHFVELDNSFGPPVSKKHSTKNKRINQPQNYILMLIDRLLGCLPSCELNFLWTFA